MTIFDARCSVASCPFNLGARGVTCGWLTGPGKRCHHAAYREAWQAAQELERAQRAEARPAESLTARAVAADRPMTSERARQLVTELGKI